MKWVWNKCQELKSNKNLLTTQLKKKKEDELRRNVMQAQLAYYKAKNERTTSAAVQQFYLEHVEHRLQHVEKVLGINDHQ